MCVFGHGCEITHRVTAGSGSEHFGEAEGRQGGEAPGAAAFDGDFAGISAAGLDQGLGCCGAVIDIHHAPAPVQSLPVVAAETR